jgi:polysaccharide biosynthesis transport protein
MLRSDKVSSSTPDGTELLARSDFAIFTIISYVISIVKRHFAAALVIMACSTALGLLYLFIMPPSFTTTGIMVIDTHKIQPLQQQQPIMEGNQLDPQAVLTEVEILRSPNVISSVIRKLGLAKDPEFVGNGGLFGSVLNLIDGLWGGSELPSESERQDRAIAAIERRCTVSRVGLTYVMAITCRSMSPVKSAKIVNAIAETYIAEQLDSKSQAARRSSGWLQDRITELRAQAAAADQAVVDYKRAHNIVVFDNFNGNKRSVNEQQVSEVNSQLTLARAATAEAKARLDRIQDVLAQAIPDASVADALKNEVIIRLRNEYVDLAERERILEVKYGVNHLAASGLRAQMGEVLRNIFDETKKIRESYKSDYEIALAREQSLERSLAAAVSGSQTTNQAQIELRALESTSQSYRTVYDTFLQSFMRSVQQQSFPILETRLIGPATPPTQKSAPKPLIVLGISTTAGLLSSIAFASYREFSDRGFRTRAQIEETLGKNCVSTLPALNTRNVSARNSNANQIAPLGGRTIIYKDNIMNYVVNSPFSQYTEALRSVKLETDLRSGVKFNGVIGITSTLPNEGKSTIASNFAHLIAHAGSRVVLVDCDLRKPSLSDQFAPDAAVGLVQVIAGKIELADAVWTEPSIQLTFLPAGSPSKLLHTGEILGSNAMKILIDRLRDIFDYVIVDLPPLLPVIDARATANFIDSYFYVVEWGWTNRKIVERLLADTPEIYDRLLGVIFNKVEMNEMARYEGDASSHNYRKYYGP